MILGLLIAAAVLQVDPPPPESYADARYWSVQEQDLVADLAVAVLPDPLRSFFLADLPRLKGWTTNPYGPNSSVLVYECLSVFLDAGAATSERWDRAAAVRRFPRNQDRALQLYDQAASDCRTVPWRIGDDAKRLSEAFSGSDEYHKWACAGRVIHYATAVAMPFNTTSGKFFGQADWQAFLRERCDRYHGALVRRLRKRLEVETRIDPARLRPTTKAVDEAFDTAIEAYRWIDPLLDIEAAVAAELVNKPGEDLEKHEERFLDELADRAYPILEARIEAGALLAANLIVGAWIEAGKPAVGNLGPVTVKDEPVAAVTPRVETKAATAFLGSKDSDVYHKPDCVHLARVKPENRVTFEDAKAAIAKGRKPCKSCKPDVAPPATASP